MLKHFTHRVSEVYAFWEAFLGRISRSHINIQFKYIKDKYLNCFGQLHGSQNIINQMCFNFYP